MIIRESNDSSIWVRTKSHLRWCCAVVLPEVTWPEVTWREVTSVTWQEVMLVIVRKYAIRMRNRKLRHIRPSRAFWPEVTKSRDRKKPCPEVALTGWIVPVTMLNIGRGRRREHHMDTSKGGHVTFGHYGCCATSAWVHSRESRRGQVTFGSHVTTTKKKNAGKSWACGEPLAWSPELSTRVLYLA
jgi:hypothetical protein